MNREGVLTSGLLTDAKVSPLILSLEENGDACHFSCIPREGSGQSGQFAGFVSPQFPAQGA
jgi:hypothetical protein